MKLIDRLKKSESMIDVAKIASGTMIGQVISFVAVPIYTRMYGASILGTWTIINSIATVITSFSDFGLKNAIMIEKEEETEKLYTAITTLTALIAAITGIISGFYYGYIDKSLGMNPAIAGLMIGLVSFLTPQTQTCYTWLNKKGEYNILMKNPLIHNVAMAVITIGLGALGYIQYGYYIGVIAGSIITILRMKIYLPRRLFNFHFDDYRQLIKTKKEFYLYQMPTNVLGQFKEQVPVFAIQSLFGVEMLGYYSITMKYLKLPINLLAQSIGRVFFKTVAEMTRKGQGIGEYAFRNVCRAMKLAVVPLIFIYAAGDVMCPFLFGSDYIIAGNIMRIVASNSFFMFIMVSCQGMTVTLHKQRNNMIASILQMVGYAGGIGLGYALTRSIYVSCALMTIAYALVQGVFFATLFEAAGVSWKRYAAKVGLYLSMIFIGTFAVRGILLFFGIVATW